MLDAKASQGLALVAVNLGEDEKTTRAFVKEHELSFPIWRDEPQATAQDWRVFAYPTSFLLDLQGRTRFVLSGGADWQERSLVEQIDRLLQESEQ